jgi:hypothetical protein
MRGVSFHAVYGTLTSLILQMVLHADLSDGVPPLDELCSVAPFRIFSVCQRHLFGISAVQAQPVWVRLFDCRWFSSLAAAWWLCVSRAPCSMIHWERSCCMCYLVFQAASAIFTFCSAVCSLKGGSGGRTAAGCCVL